MRQISSSFYDEQKRFELLKAIAPSIIRLNSTNNKDTLTKNIVSTTDAIIEELTKATNRTKDSGY
jgi:hypothetical protein